MKSTSSPAVSDAEAQVMEVLWQRSPQAADEIAGALAGKQDWQLSTVKTLLGRLVQKGAVHAAPDRRRFLYSPLLQRQDWLRAQSVGLLDRFFGGQLAPLVAQFSAQRKLTPQDRAALEKLLREQGDE
jgi:BlaI family transcriptional regulator, penicillinase repressor